MVDKNPDGTAAALPRLSAEDEALLDLGDPAALRSLLAELRREIAQYRQATADQHAQKTLVDQLREANHHLLLATFGAQDLQAAAEAESKAKEEFLSMLAHELRNPLAPIVMANALLGKLSEAHPMLPKLHGIIDRQTRHLKRLVEDLLDASPISSGKITLQRSPILLSEIIESAIETSQPQLDKRRQQLTVTLPPAPIVIDGDLVRLAQVFSNLLINAAKFSGDNTEVHLEVERRPDCIAISVQDHGAGIAADFQPFVFDLFRQSASTLDRTHGGLGIGLSLVRSIAQMHGGSVIVSSAGLGTGSKFTVTLPETGAQPAGTSAASTTSGISLPISAAHVLVIEESPDAANSLSTMLRLEGWTVNTAPDGKTGLSLARELSFDIVICDIGLPQLDTVDLVRQLKRLLKPHAGLIAVADRNQPKNHTTAIEAGFDHFLPRPVAMAVLLQAISSCTMH